MESLVAVAPHCKFRGFDGRRKNVPEIYKILELHEALKRSYNTDAHLVSYIVPGADHQPRINKPGLPYFGRPVEMGVFFCDIDNPDHMDWTDDMVDVAMEQYDTLEVLQTAGIYHTAHGARIVQPIAQAIPVEDVEPYIRQWLLELEDDGLAVDWACADWTRHFRLPNVRRDGELYRSPYIDLTRMHPIEVQTPLMELWESEIHQFAATMTTRERPPPQRINWSSDIPSAWREYIKDIAKAVSEVRTEWHTLFMALAGALLQRKVPPEHVPALIRAISTATARDTKTTDRETSAKTTIDRWLSGAPFTGYQKLAEEWPEVAITVDRAITQMTVVSSPSSNTPDKAEADAEAEPDAPLDLEKITDTLDKNIHTAPPGVMLISAECGLGKTEATIREAKERKTMKPKTGNRAPLNSKTSFSVCTNALAEQLQARFFEMGVSSKRIFGPLSVLQDDGKTPECRYHKVATALVAGGQSITRELCEGRGRRQCEFYDECKAKLGYIGPHNDQITIGPHALISALDGAAGITGLLVIDEPPPLLESGVITIDNLTETKDTISSFDRDYAEALKPVLQIMQHWIIEESPSYRTILDIVKDYDVDVIENIKELNFPDPRNTAPPLRQIEITIARNSITKARTLGRASKILNILYKALIGLHVSANVIKNKALAYTHLNQDLINALKREGSTIVMDANISTYAKDYEKILGYNPPLHEFNAPDSAPIKRIHLYCSEAARKYWIPCGKMVVQPSLKNAFRYIFKLVKEADFTITKIGLITLKPIRLALDCILRPGDQVATDAWERAGQSIETLEELRQRIGPIISGWDGELILGHYGAMRGLNTMADVDCLVTLGDPWPNIGQVARDMNYMETPELTEERIVALCRDELEQAHGRLRTIHRTRPGRAMHVGRVLPGGSGWNSGDVEVVRIRPLGRTPSGDMTVEELGTIITKIGSVVAAAKVAGCGRRYLYDCKSGKRPVSKKIGDSLRKFIGE